MVNHYEAVLIGLMVEDAACVFRLRSKLKR